MMGLLQTFNQSMLAAYDLKNNSPSGATFRSTLMVAALSYAFSKDLRQEFRALSFPIDDAVYQQLYQNVISLSDIGSLAQIATGGGWKTRLTLVKFREHSCHSSS
jgi:hypothetical protein